MTNSKANHNWIRIGLMSEHGILALPKSQNPSPSRNLHWIKPDGGVEKLTETYPTDISRASRENWSPWLNIYLLSGESIKYSKAKYHITLNMAENINTDASDASLIAFNPNSGATLKIPRPSQLTNAVQVADAFATRAGILWQSYNSPPWGAYISNNTGIRKISANHIARMTVSPDGCRAAMGYFKSPGNFTSKKQLQFINFCN